MAGKQTEGRAKRKHRGTTTAKKDENTDDKCGRCSKVVRDKDMALICDICETWHHAKCEQIPDDIYKFVAGEEAGSQFTWHCVFCKKGCGKLKTHVEKLEKLQVDLIEKQDILQEEVKEIREAVKIDKEDLNQISGRAAVLETKALDTSEHVNKDKESLQDLNSQMERVEIKILKMEENPTHGREIETRNGEHQVSKVMQKVMDVNTFLGGNK